MEVDDKTEVCELQEYDATYDSVPFATDVIRGVTYGPLYR